MRKKDGTHSVCEIRSPRLAARLYELDWLNRLNLEALCFAVLCLLYDAVVTNGLAGAKGGEGREREPAQGDEFRRLDWCG